MPTPQVEDGYTRLANELLDAIIRFPFTKRQYKVMLLLARKTYGYNKKADVISYGRIAEACGLKRQHVIATISELLEMNAITASPSGVHVRGGELNLLGINKRYSAWCCTSPKTVTSPETGLVPKQSLTSPKTGNSLVPKQGPTKDNPKDNNKRQGRFTPPTVEEVREYCRERGNSVDPSRFVDHYEANGWMRGKTKIKDWKACVRTWEQNSKGKRNSDDDIFAGAK